MFYSEVPCYILVLFFLYYRLAKAKLSYPPTADYLHLGPLSRLDVCQIHIRKPRIHMLNMTSPPLYMLSPSDKYSVFVSHNYTS